MREVPRVRSAPVHAQGASVAVSVNPNPSPLPPILEEVTGRDPVADETAVARTPARVTSTVVFVSDLTRSVRFYRDVFSCEVRVDACEAALLLSPRGFQIYLIARARRTPHPSGGIGLQYLIWAVENPDELDDLERSIQARGHRTYRHTSGGITYLTGRDPDGIQIVVTHPGPDALPRVLIDNSLYA